MSKHTEEWNQLVLSLEQALESTKRLRTLYSNPSSTISFPEQADLSVPMILVALAKDNSGKLVVKKVIGSIAESMGSSRDSARNNIYVSLCNNRKKWLKVSPGVYQLRDLNE